MNLHVLSLNQNHVRFMSLSWQFHGTFTYKPYLGTVCQNLLEKLSKKSVLVVDLFFLPNFSFIFGNMSDSCRFHGPFMALSWRFLPSDFYCFSKQFHGTCMADSWQIHRGFIADSCQFLSIPKNQNHVRFMSLSWHFHGSFMALSHTSLTWVQSAKIYWKKLSKKSVLVVDLVFWPNFSFIFGNMSDSCRFHGPCMALSWHFLPSDFYHFFLKKIQTNN